MTAFDAPFLDRLRQERVVKIETSAGPDQPVHAAPIWIVVDDAGRVLIRSVRGIRGRWYRELVAHPAGAVRTREERVAIHAEQAGDAARVAAYGAAVVAKYGDTASTRSVLRDETLPATLELLPG